MVVTEGELWHSDDGSAAAYIACQGAKQASHQRGFFLRWAV